MESEQILTFYRDSNGPLIATAEYCQDKQGTSTIHMVEPSAEILLEHAPRKLLVIPPKTSFSLDGIKYCWHGYSNLYRDDVYSLAAQYKPISPKKHDQKVGQLLIRGYDSHFINVVVISSFILQQRSEARKRKVIPSRICRDLRVLFAIRNELILNMVTTISFSYFFPWFRKRESEWRCSYQVYSLVSSCIGHAR